MKDKWSLIFCLFTFTAGANTTSQVESMNRLVKRCLNHRSEVLSLISLIEELETSSLIALKATPIHADNDQILQSICDNVGEVIYQHQNSKFKEQNKYSKPTKKCRINIFGFFFTVIELIKLQSNTYIS